jgi:ribosome recycling factor
MYTQDLKQKYNSLYDHYFDQLKTIRTNKISSSLLDNIIVEAYGTKQNLNTLGNISVQFPNILIIEI